MIAQSELEKRILGLVAPEAGRLGLEIVRVRLTGGRRPTLQLMVERAGGAATDVEDCAALSRALSPVLEAADPVPDAYTLEVSTPGVDRPLTRPGDFARWAGHLAKIELARPLEGRRRFQGVITREDEDGVAIQLSEQAELVARIEDMSKASLVLTDDLIDAARPDTTGSVPARDKEKEA